VKILASSLKRHNLLVTTDLVRDISSFQRVAEVYRSNELDEGALANLLPQIDALLIFNWPEFLTEERLGGMKQLRFIQSILVGVNHIPFDKLGSRVIVCSNAGAYSLEVGEHAFGLLLSAAKRVVETNNSVRMGKTDFKEFRGVATDILVLRGKTLGVIGYGGIGAVVARLGKSFGMRVIALPRKRGRVEKGVELRWGTGALPGLLAEADAVVLAVPLTRSTEEMIGARELLMMKKSAILVNISRGDVVNQGALFEHLKLNPKFTYATDVWWFKEGRETLITEYPLTSLPNFIGTPHISGPTALSSGRPQKMAVLNTIRYLEGLRPENVVRRSEYLTGQS